MYTTTDPVRARAIRTPRAAAFADIEASCCSVRCSSPWLQLVFPLWVLALSILILVAAHPHGTEPSNQPNGAAT